MPFLIILALMVPITIWAIRIYKRLVRLRNDRTESFPDVDLQLKKRQELIPELTQTLKGLDEPGKGSLQKVSEGLSAALSATTIDDKIRAEQHLSRVLQAVTTQIETSLTASSDRKLTQQLKELTQIGSAIATHRQTFNAATAKYNLGLQTFPSSIIASNFGFTPEIFYQDENESTPELAGEPTLQQ